MALLIDTNVLLRSVQPSHVMHPIAIRALEVPRYSSKHRRILERSNSPDHI